MTSTSKRSLLARLERIASVLTTVTTLEQLAETIEMLIGDFLSVQYTGVYLLDPDSLGLRLYSARGFTEAERAEAERTAPFRHPGHVFRAQEPLHVCDTEADEERETQTSRRGFTIRSHLYLPIIKKAESVGVLELGASHPDAFHHDAHIRQLTFAANLAGVVYGNLLADQALHRQRQRYELAIEGAELGLWDWDVQAGRFHLNPRWATMLGYRLDEIEPHLRAWESLLHPDERDQVTATLEAHLRGEVPLYETEHRARARDGSWVWVLARGAVCERDAAGNPLRAVGTLLDITRRKAEEVELCQARYEAEASNLDLLETLAEFQRMNRLMYGRERRILELKRRIDELLAESGRPAEFGDDGAEPSVTLAMYGAGAAGSRAPVVPIGESDGWSEESLDSVERYPRASGEVGTDVCRDGPCDRLQNLERLMEAQERELLEQREVAISIAEDADLARKIATAAKLEAEESNKALQLAVERAKELAAEAASADRAKSTFLQAMSHEIRTPLNVIVGMTDLLGATLHHDDEIDLARRLKSNAEMLAALVGDILDFSRIEADQLDVDEREFDLRVILVEISDLADPLAASRGLRFHCETAPQTPRRIIGDSQRIRQILINLVSNAVQATDEGSVTVRVSIDPVPGEANSSSAAVDIRFVVQDTGCGIAAADLERIFDPFEQIVSPGDRSQGTGLGLAISRRLAHAMGGRLDVESAVGNGSTFRLVLPLQVSGLARSLTTSQERERLSRDPDEEWIPWGATPIGSGARVLVVDDNEDGRVFARRALERAGFAVSEASGGQEALAALRECPFPVVLMDLQMPDMDGLSCAGAIREMEDRRDDPRAAIIALTAHGLEEHRRQCFGAGMDEYLTKPIRATALIEVVAAWSRALPTVLLVEDHPDSRFLVRRWVLDTGRARVVSAATGQEAVEAAARHRFDLALLDHELPDMDGIDLARELRVATRGAMPRLVSLTGHETSTILDRIRAAGFEEILTKPIDQEEFQALLQRMLPPVQDVPGAGARAGEARTAGAGTSAGLDRVDPDPAIADLVPRYLDSRRADLASVRRLAAARDHEAIRRIGHQWKGSGGSYDLPEITRLGRALSAAARDEDEERIQQAIDAATAYLEKVNA